MGRIKLGLSWLIIFLITFSILVFFAWGSYYLFINDKNVVYKVAYVLNGLFWVGMFGYFSFGTLRIIFNVLKGTDTRSPFK